MKMKSSSVATYGNQRLIALVGSPCSAICVWATSYRVSPIVCLRSGLSVRRVRMVRSPSSDREDRPEHQVRDGLRDREVDRPEVDRDPVVLLELGRRVEVPAREGGLRREQREPGEDEQDRAAWSRRLRPEVARRARDRARTCTRGRTSSSVVSARLRFAASAAKSTISRAISLKRSANAWMPEFAGLAPGFERARITRRSSAWRPSHSSAASAQPAMLQPNEGDHRQQQRDHDRPACRRQQVIGSERRVEKRAPSISRCFRTERRPRRFHRGSRPPLRTVRRLLRSRRPSRRGRRRRRNLRARLKNAAGTGGVELRRGGPLHPSARIAA